MPDQKAISFDTFTGREAERMKTVMAELGSAPWAHGILREVERGGGLIGKNMAPFFELRFGHALHEAGIAVEYEIAGEGASTLDFGFTSKGQRWKVEMMRLLPQPPVIRKGASDTFYDKGLEGASYHAVIPNVKASRHPPDWSQIQKCRTGIARMGTHFRSGKAQVCVGQGPVDQRQPGPFARAVRLGKAPLAGAVRAA